MQDNIDWIALMESLKGRKKWTEFHSAAAKRLFKDDIKNSSAVKAAELPSKLKEKREVLECEWANIETFFVPST